jgi:uncharacterized ferritin-like protein (DUF455 family)
VDLRDFAVSVLTATTVEGKLRPPPAQIESGHSGSGSISPLSRPPGLAIQPGGRVRVPPAKAWPDTAQRVRILHALANHELQAAELFAWAILRFANSPEDLRRGWLRILADEQRHCALYVARLEAHGARFGDFPVSGHFWSKTKDLATPLAFICAMGLTFENANLDFGGEYVAAARATGDEDSARALLAVHADEIRHVRFAWEWLARMKDPAHSMWDAYVANVAPPHGPRRARGAAFDRLSRVAAGFDEDFIARLGATSPEAPGGAARC